MKPLFKGFFIIVLIFVCNLSSFAQCSVEDIHVPRSVEPHNKREKPKTLVVETKGIKEIKLWVYNQQGTKVFESSSSIIDASVDKSKMLDTGWDGTKLGEELKAGAYVYTMEAKCLDNSSVRKNGSIILTIEKE